MIYRTTIRIDHEEGDTKVKSIINTVKASGLTTSHYRGKDGVCEIDREEGNAVCPAGE